jgi:hypothetical protein
MDLHAALAQFDLAAVNLRRLDNTWSRLIRLVDDDGIENEQRYEQLRRDYHAIAAGLPAINGFRITEYPSPALDVWRQLRYLRELGPDDKGRTWENLRAPGRALEEYHDRFDRARGDLVRQRLRQLVSEVDQVLEQLVGRVPKDREPVTDPAWATLNELIAEVERLMADAPRHGRWEDLRRHLWWGQGVDAHDIHELDWPTIRVHLEAGFYSESEPLSVEVDDLGTLARETPASRVSSKLTWNRLDEEDFERLLFNLVAEADGYENARWLTHTKAPDRGRDISVDRRLVDSLGSATTQRVIIQAKHWQTKSVAPFDIQQALAPLSLWEPPAISVLVLATSGRFTSDAVAWAEKHNHEGRRPTIELWPDSHLERLLARRPDLVAEFHLR